MKNIRLFELESDYHNDKANHEYPTVSYTKDTEKVYYYEKQSLLPIIDTSSLATDFVYKSLDENGEYTIVNSYFHEAIALSKIYSKFFDEYSETNRIEIYLQDESEDYNKGEYKGLLRVFEYVDGDQVTTDYDIRKEPLFIEYLSKIRMAEPCNGIYDEFYIIDISLSAYQSGDNIYVSLNGCAELSSENGFSYGCTCL